MFVFVFTVGHFVYELCQSGATMSVSKYTVPMCVCVCVFTSQTKSVRKVLQSRQIQGSAFSRSTALVE